MPEIRTREIHVPERKKSHGTRKGLYKPKNPEKYEGNVNNIVYRSKIELRLMNHLDLHPDVLKWSSEEVVVPYIHPHDGKIHRYFVDFKVERKTKTGKIVTTLIEVKWSTQKVAPKVPKKKTRRYYRELKTWEINSAKWAAAQKLCEAKGWQWAVMTEKNLDL